MTKKTKGDQKFWRMKVKKFVQKFQKVRKFFRNRGGNLKQAGEMHHYLRGVGASEEIQISALFKHEGLQISQIIPNDNRRLIINSCSTVVGLQSFIRASLFCKWTY